MVKLIFGPRVTVLAETAYSGVPWFSQDEGLDAEKLSEFSSRLCYMSFGNKVEDSCIDGHKVVKGRSSLTKHLHNLIRSGHHSIFEHYSISLLIEGVSKSLTHQLVRHRVGMSYSQLSSRYVDESETAFVVHPTLLDAGVDIVDLQEYYANCLKEYKLLASRLRSLGFSKKKANEAARSVLPSSVETKIVVTGNIRAWRHFIELRGNDHADVEIRRLAVIIYNTLSDKVGALFDDFTLIYDEDSLDYYVCRSNL